MRIRRPQERVRQVAAPPEIREQTGDLGRDGCIRHAQRLKKGITHRLAIAADYARRSSGDRGRAGTEGGHEVTVAGRAGAQERLLGSVCHHLCRVAKGGDERPPDLQVANLPQGTRSGHAPRAVATGEVGVEDSSAPVVGEVVG